MEHARSVLIAAAFGLTLFPAMATASTLDFTGEWAPFYQGVSSKTLTNATVSTTGADLYSYGVPNAFCGVTTAGGLDCSTDSTITFNSAVSGLTFSSYVWHNGDFAVASIFSGATLLASIDVTSDMLIDFSLFSGITSLFLDDKGQGPVGNGMGYQNFSFSFEGTEVPLPAALPLLAAGLGAMGIMGWRKKRKALTA